MASAMTLTAPAVGSIAAALLLAYLPHVVKSYYILRAGVRYNNVSPVRLRDRARAPAAAGCVLTVCRRARPAAGTADASVRC